jgi:hypothetical protein
MDTFLSPEDFNLTGFLDVAETVDKCIQYCKKEKNYIEIGNEATVKFQGRLSDLESVFESVGKKGLNQTILQYPVLVSKCLRTAEKFESILTKKFPPMDKKSYWICGASGNGKSILAKYLAKIFINNPEIEPNYYTENSGNWFCDFDAFSPVTIVNNCQIKTQKDYQFVLGLTGTDPFMILGKGTSKWFNSKVVIITSINSIGQIWNQLPDDAKNSHQFWELGRRIQNQIVALVINKAPLYIPFIISYLWHCKIFYTFH